MTEALSDLEHRMLEAGEFHIDGWTTERGKAAVARLEKLGLITTFITGTSGSSQQTTINCTVTAAGRARTGRWRRG